MTHKDRRRHPKHWPNAVKDEVILLELRQPNPPSPLNSEQEPKRNSIPKSKPKRNPVPKNNELDDASLPTKITLANGDKISRAAQRHRLNVIKVVPRFGRPHFEFFCSKTGAMVFSFHPKTSDCTFDIRGDGGRVTKSVRVKNLFHALKSVACRDDIVARGKIEQRWKSPTRRND